jgi:hypothetical protein
VIAASWCCCGRVSRVVLSGILSLPLIQKTPVLAGVGIYWTAARSGLEESRHHPPSSFQLLVYIKGL